MKEMSDADLHAALADACDAAKGADFQSVVTVADRLRKVAQDDDDPIRALIAALEYHLVLDPDRRGAFGVFGPMIEAGGKAYPAPVDRIDPDVLPLWERAEIEAPLRLVAGRFADLLWTARFGAQPYRCAQRAVDHYIAASNEEFGSPVEISEPLQRAYELAAEINDAERVAQVTASLVALARSAIDSAENLPGVALPILELLVTSKRDAPPELATVVDDAVERYRADPWNFEAALNIKASLATPQDRSSLRKAQVDAFAALARRSDGLVKYAHYQHAIELAGEHGLRAEAEDLRREVEGLPADALELKTISAEVELPHDEIEKFIGAVVGDDDLPSALARFGAHIPTGSPEDNAKFISEMMSEHPLQFLFTKMILGPEKSLIKAVQTPEEHGEHALLEHELQRLQFFSVFAVEMLGRMRERYGSLRAGASWFKSDLIDAEVARRIGRAIELFEDGDFDSAASILAPRLERVVREIARAVGLTITRSPDRFGRAGGVKGLGDLLSALQGPLPEATRRYLRALLSEIAGLNLRNRISHGLVEEVSDRESAMLIHAACHLRLLVPRNDDAP